MSKLEAALSAWIAFHASIGVDIKPTLQAPAQESDIQAVEHQIGFKLPDDLRELYKIANGQLDPYDHEEQLINAMQPGQPWAPLFGNYQFLSLEHALMQYQYLVDSYDLEMELYKADNERIDNYNKANPEQPRELNFWNVREGDPVDPSGGDRKWFMFAGTGPNGYTVDMTPAQGGSIGQVVEYGPDLGGLFVVGSSITDLMEQSALRLDPQEEKRYPRHGGEDNSLATVYFDMDWRKPSYDEQEHNDSAVEMPPAYRAWVEEVAKKQAQKISEFADWLKQQNLAEQDIHDTVHLVEFDLHFERTTLPPEHLLKEIEAFALSRGVPMMPRESLPTPEETERGAWYSYYMALANNVFISSHEYDRHIGSTIGEGMLREEAIILYHQYLLQTGTWTNEQYNNVEKLRADFTKLEFIDGEESAFFHMRIEGHTLIVCQSVYNDDTQQSSEHCDEINLDRYQQ